MMTILITGDNMMRPEKFKAAIEAAFGGNTFMIRTKFYGFSQTGFYVEPGTSIPSGMCFEDPMRRMTYPDHGVSEFYGEPCSLVEDIKGVDILIIHGAALPREVMENADRLKYIIALRGGPANIDLEYARKKGIGVFNTNGKNAPAVAEFALGALLDFERGISFGSKRLGEGWWWIKGADSCESHEIRGKKFGFIGYGHIAQELRKLLSGFDIEAFAYSPHISNEILDKDNVKRLELEELVSTCDYVTLHARPEKGKPPLMSAALLRKMQKHSVLVNTGRGALVDHAALKDVLREKKIRGAVLDVLGNEPFGFYKELIALDSTLITPHIAGQSAETCERACSMSVALLREIVDSLGQ